jgi:hypothetical protein
MPTNWIDVLAFLDCGTSRAPPADGLASSPSADVRSWRHYVLVLCSLRACKFGGAGPGSVSPEIQFMRTQLDRQRKDPAAFAHEYAKGMG